MRTNAHVHFADKDVLFGQVGMPWGMTQSENGCLEGRTGERTCTRVPSMHYMRRTLSALLSVSMADEMLTVLELSVRGVPKFRRLLKHEFISYMLSQVERR